jgi:YD repeat-containing protein
MICGIGYWSTNPSDGTQAATALFYLNGQLSAVVNPGGEATDFAYDTNGMLNGVRNPAQADWAAANPTHAGDLAYATQISYDSAGRAATIAPATPSVGGTRGPHSYDYNVGGASTARVHIAGMAEPLGYQRQVTYDAAGQQLTDTDADGHTSSVSYDPAGDVVSATDPASRTSTTFYNTDGQPTDAYGPAPASCFDATTHVPNGTCTSPPPAHTHTGYDDGLAGLNGTWWDNNSMSGAPVVHSVGAGNASGGDPDSVHSGAINADWGANRPTGIASGSAMSVLFVGTVHLAAAGT